MAIPLHISVVCVFFINFSADIFLLIHSFQSISPGIVKTNIASQSEKMRNIFEKIPFILPEDIVDAIIYALGTRQEVQV